MGIENGDADGRGSGRDAQSRWSTQRSTTHGPGTVPGDAIARLADADNADDPGEPYESSEADPAPAVRRRAAVLATPAFLTGIPASVNIGDGPRSALARASAPPAPSIHGYTQSRYRYMVRPVSDQAVDTVIERGASSSSWLLSKPTVRIS